MFNGSSYSKASDVLFPAADIALDKIKNLEIIIIGEDFSGELFDKLWNKVRNKERITLAGEKNSNDVREALWSADFFIISSRVESQSVSTLEALATGLPVVCTEVVPETIANSVNSIRVPVEDIERLAEAIISMAENHQSYNKKQIASEIQKIADKKVVAEALLDAYESILIKK